MKICCKLPTPSVKISPGISSLEISFLILNFFNLLDDKVQSALAPHQTAKICWVQKSLSSCPNLCYKIIFMKKFPLLLRLAIVTRNLKNSSLQAYVQLLWLCRVYGKQSILLSKFTNYEQRWLIELFHTISFTVFCYKKTTSKFLSACQLFCDWTARRNKRNWKISFWLK